MESPKIIYEQLKRIDKIKDVAYQRLFLNYLQLDLKGDKKLIEVDSTDRESLIKNFNFGVPIPGLMYTFFHINEKELATIINEKNNQEFKYHDFAPILFCTYSNPVQKVFGGINMNLLPSSERLKFLIAFYEKYKEFFEDVEEKTQNKKIALNQKYIALVLTGRNRLMVEHFNRAQNALFDYGYRKYLVPNIRKFRMVEYEEWMYLPYFVPKEAFKKMGVDLIHRIYWENKNSKTL